MPSSKNKKTAAIAFVAAMALILTMAAVVVFGFSRPADEHQKQKRKKDAVLRAAQGIKWTKFPKTMILYFSNPSIQPANFYGQT